MVFSSGGASINSVNLCNSHSGCAAGAEDDRALPRAYCNAHLRETMADFPVGPDGEPSFHRAECPRKPQNRRAASAYRRIAAPASSVSRECRRAAAAFTDPAEYALWQPTEGAQGFQGG